MMSRAKLFRRLHLSSRHRLQGLQSLGVPTSAVMRILVQKPPPLLTLPTIDLHQRFQVVYSCFKCSLEFGVSWVHQLHVHERLAFWRSNLDRSLGLQVTAQSFSVRSGHPNPNNCGTCRRPTEVSTPMRLALGRRLGLDEYLRSSSAPTSTSRRLFFL